MGDMVMSGANELLMARSRRNHLPKASVPTVVQATANQSSNATSVAYTFTKAPTAGNTLYAFVTGRSASPSTTPPAGWALVQMVNPKGGSSPFGVTCIFSKVSDGSETTTSFSIPGSPVYLSVTACEIHGTSGIDAQVWNTTPGTYVSPPYDFGPCTPSVGNCLALAFSDVDTSDANAWGTITPSSGWTLSASLPKLYCAQALAWQNCGAAGAAMDGTMNYSGGSTQGKYTIAGMLILKP